MGQKKFPFNFIQFLYVPNKVAIDFEREYDVHVYLTICSTNNVKGFFTSSAKTRWTNLN